MIRPGSRNLRVASAVVIILAMAGCGTTDVGGAPDPSMMSGSAGCSRGAPATTGAVTVTDDFGRKVTLEKPAARVASTEWQQTEDLLTLCLTPVAVADTKGYAAYDTAEKLPHGVTDVGTRSEPDLDALAGVAPDLVIVEATAADDPRVTGLEKRGVKVLATKGADATDPVAHMRSLFTLIAEVTGRTDRADQVLTELDSHVDEARSKVMRAGLATRDFVYLDGWVEGGNVTIRPFGRGALFSALGERLGLTAAWNGQVDSTYGLGQTCLQIEAL